MRQHTSWGRLTQRSVPGLLNGVDYGMCDFALLLILVHKHKPVPNTDSLPRAGALQRRTLAFDSCWRLTHRTQRFRVESEVQVPVRLLAQDQQNHFWSWLFLGIPSGKTTSSSTREGHQHSCCPVPFTSDLSARQWNLPFPVVEIQKEFLTHTSLVSEC